MLRAGLGEDLLLATTALAVSAAAVPGLARVAPRLGMVDLPDGRKRHAGAVPLVGGCAYTLALFVALACAALLYPIADVPGRWFLLAVLLIFFAGALDDAVALPPWLKALIELGAVLLALLPAHLEILSFGSVLGAHHSVTLGDFALPYTLLCLIGFVNAFNMLDGVDGQAGGIAFVTFGFLGGAAWLAGAPQIFVVALVSGAALAGFLAFNMRTPWRHRAAVFLGDQGSLVLGLVLGWSAIRLASPRIAHPLSPMAVAWILGLPVVDTLVVMARRLVRGRSPFQPDRLHLHHILLDLGLVPGKVAGIMMAVAAGYGAVGLLALLFRIPDWLLFAAAPAALLVHAAFVAFAARRIARRAGRGRAGGAGGGLPACVED